MITNIFDMGNKKKSWFWEKKLSRNLFLSFFLLKILKNKFWGKCSTFVSRFSKFQKCRVCFFMGRKMLKNKIRSSICVSRRFLLLSRFFLWGGGCRSMIFKIFYYFQDFSIFRRFLFLPSWWRRAPQCALFIVKFRGSRRVIYIVY